MSNATRKIKPSYGVRMGKEKLRIGPHPEVTPQMRARARARAYELKKRLQRTTEEK